MWDSNKEESFLNSFHKDSCVSACPEGSFSVSALRHTPGDFDKKKWQDLAPPFCKSTHNIDLHTHLKNNLLQYCRKLAKHLLAAETSPLNSWSWGIYIAWRASSGCRLRQFQGKGENQRCCQFCNILPTILDPVAENLASTFHVAKNSILVHPTRESAHLHGCMERRKASHPT